MIVRCEELTAKVAAPIERTALPCAVSKVRNKNISHENDPYTQSLHHPHGD